MEIWKDNDKDRIKAARVELNKFLENHPNFSPAYMVRAMGDFCSLASNDFDSIGADIGKALNTVTPDTSMFEPPNIIAIRGKLRFEAGRYKGALDDLETALKEKLDNADSIFGSGETKPEDKNANPCIWTMGNLDVLAEKFPKDYRVPMLRGLYLKFFTTFDEVWYQRAGQEFQKAALLNPRSPLPHYFIGELYFKASLLTKAAWSSDEGKNEPERKAIAAFSKAIQLDPTFQHAYELRAAAHLGLKQYSQAIADYDRVLELNPENVTAYADRGLAKLEVRQYLAATIDLGGAIRRKKENEDTNALSLSYEYRADAYSKLGMYRDAIENYSKAIKYQLAGMTHLISLKQFRGLYPEYDKVSDEVLIRKINALFWPQYDYTTMSHILLDKESEWKISMINDLYEKRGDCYLRSGDYRRGVLDFNRIFKGIPDFGDTVERWRGLSGKAGEEWYVDVKSTEFAVTPRLWAKFAEKKGGYTVQSLDFDCKSRRIAVTSTAVYGKDDDLLNSSAAGGGWQRVIPSSKGEQMYNGMCGTR